MHLASLTNEELVSYFRTTRNDFTTTALEAELAERLAAAIDGKDDEIEELRKGIRDLEAQLEEAGEDTCHDVEALQKKLDDIEDIITNR